MNDPLTALIIIQEGLKGIAIFSSVGIIYLVLKILLGGG